MNVKYREIMKRKPLKESPENRCICGHTRKQHYQFIYEQDPVLVAKLRKSHGSWFNEGASGCAIGWDIKSKIYCHCDKYLDRRHCKIKKDDPVLLYCRKEFDIVVTGMEWDGVGSLATISRRVTLFKFLGMLKEEGWSARFTTRAMAYAFNEEVYQDLIKEGIIV